MPLSSPAAEDEDALVKMCTAAFGGFACVLSLLVSIFTVQPESFLGNLLHDSSLPSQSHLQLPPSPSSASRSQPCALHCQ